MLRLFFDKCLISHNELRILKLNKPRSSSIIVATGGVNPWIKFKEEHLLAPSFQEGEQQLRIPASVPVYFVIAGMTNANIPLLWRDVPKGRGGCIQQRRILRLAKNNITLILINNLENYFF